MTETVTDTPIVEEDVAIVEAFPVAQEDDLSLSVAQEEESIAPVVEQIQEEIIAQDEVVVPIQVVETEEETFPTTAEETQGESLPVTAAVAQQDNLSPPAVAEELEKVQDEVEPNVEVEAVAITSENEGPITVDDEIVLAQIEEELKDSLVPVAGGESQDIPENPLEFVEEKPVQPVGEIIVVKEVAVQVELEDEPVVDVQDGGVAQVGLIQETDEDEVAEELIPPQLTHPPSRKTSYKKKYPAITESPSVLPGLTQKPVKYIKPPGIAADPKHEWNGYSTWWTKLGNRVAKNYNYE